MLPKKSRSLFLAKFYKELESKESLKFFLHID